MWILGGPRDAANNIEILHYVHTLDLMPITNLVETTKTCISETGSRLNYTKRDDPHEQTSNMVPLITAVLPNGGRMQSST